MCTAITYRTRDFYFGRTLDYECGYAEEITVTPRGYLGNRYALIGMATVVDGYPLYYDAVNEVGLCMAGLNFVQNACYQSGEGVAPHELIPRTLGGCATVAQAKQMLEETRLIGRGFGDLPIARLHWLVADKQECLVVEPHEEGLRLYDNPMGVLANDPPFPMQIQHLRAFRHLSPQTPPGDFGLPLEAIGRGTGSVGLPGDFTSPSRFVRAAFVRANAVSFTSETESVSQFFHMLDAVSIPRGVCDIGEGHYHHTLYSSCINASRGIYYCTTYDNRRIAAARLERTGERLRRYPIFRQMEIDSLKEVML
jgi:choloylglycine hydrolase